MKKAFRYASFLLSTVLATASLFVSACNTHKHNLTAVEEKAATCTSAGNSAYWYCGDCGKYFSDEAASCEITREKTVAVALGHDTELVALGENQTSSNGSNEYWHCRRCGGAFAEEAAATPVDVLSKMFTDRYFYESGTANGPDVFASTLIGGDFAPIDSQQFVMRFFMGFTYDVSQLPSGKNVEIHMNIHRTEADPNWWQFIFRYHPTAGLETVIMETSVTGAGTKNHQLDPEWAAVVKQQNGLYLLLQRDGDRLAFYAEDAKGVPRLLFSVTGFSLGAIYQMRIAHFEQYYADATHGGVIKDMEIACDTLDLNAERTQYAAIAVK